MIAIPNMEKPKSCISCPLMEHWITGTILCGGCNQKIKGSVMDSVQDFCPLIEIVRCKDCKWSYIDEKYECTMWCRVHFHEYRVDSDGFCSFGERRSE